MLKGRVLQIVVVAFTTAILVSLILGMTAELFSAEFPCGVIAAATSAVTAVYTVKSKREF